MISLYVERKNLIQGVPYIPLLYPFWGVEVNKNTPYPNDALGNYGFDGSHYRLTDIPKEADYILLPHNYWHVSRAHDSYIERFVRIAREAKKPLLIDARSDIEQKVTVPGSVVLKIAQYRFKLQPEEVIVPTYVDDLLEHYQGGEFIGRQKSTKPTVGFAGWATLSPWVKTKTRIKELPIFFKGIFDSKYRTMHKGVLFREKALSYLKQVPNLSLQLLPRPSYSGHLKTISGNSEVLRREFVNNILSSDYALDVRGDANASCRFYEILSLGRIPLFIDTERVLPLEDKINYKEFCLWVDWKDLSRVGDKVLFFHDHIPPEQFIEMQTRARHVFSTMLRIDRFTPYLMEELKKRAQAFTV